MYKEKAKNVKIKHGSAFGHANLHLKRRIPWRPPVLLASSPLHYCFATKKCVFHSGRNLTLRLSVSNALFLVQGRLAVWKWEGFLTYINFSPAMHANWGVFFWNLQILCSCNFAVAHCSISSHKYQSFSTCPCFLTWHWFSWMASVDLWMETVLLDPVAHW